MNRSKLLRPLVATLTVALLLPALAAAADTGPTPLVANEKMVTPAGQDMPRISWPAVAAGALVALAIHIALSTLGIGVGAAAIDPHNREHPTKGVPTTILVWMFVSGLIALFAGGLVAGRLANTVPFDSAIQGVIVWAFATVALLILATTTAGAILGGTFRLLGAGVSAAGSAASAAGSAVATVAPHAAQLAKDALGDVIPQIDWKGIQKDAKKMLHLGGGNDQGKGGDEAGKQGGQQGGGQGGQNNQGGQGKQQDGKGGAAAKMWDDNQEVMEMVTKAYGAIRDGGLANADRDELMSVISERAGVSKEEANKTVEKWEKQYREAKVQYDAALAKAEQKARDAAAATTSAISRVAVWTFASLVCGIAVAAVGGNLASVYFRL